LTTFLKQAILSRLIAACFRTNFMSRFAMAASLLGDVALTPQILAGTLLY
jgi:hypothetical protein